jgi:hypothetical protein
VAVKAILNKIRSALANDGFCQKSASRIALLMQIRAKMGEEIVPTDARALHGL